MTNAQRIVEALETEVERLRGYKEREDQEGVHIHRCPRQGESVTPCCGKTPFEIPGWHRMTAKPELVNCGRLELEAEVERLQRERDALRACGFAARTVAGGRASLIH